MAGVLSIERWKLALVAVNDVGEQAVISDEGLAAKLRIFGQFAQVDVRQVAAIRTDRACG